ncbi:MAG TPA: TonB-dependent receptor, partial [Blastocatellia bacterium]|nr:TonB-dependent receptor [Blastocatellia bacterium]
MLLSLRRFCSTVMCMALVIQASTIAFGQASSTAGAIGGTVVDQAGALIAGATVTARNIDIGKERVVTTEESGRFRMALLPVGNYEVTVSAQGFGELKRAGIVLRVGDDLDLKLEMTAAGATQVVNVTAEAPIADPGKTQVSSTINEKAIVELPINGRRWSNFVTLTPGVTPDGNFGLISFRGISGLLNNNTIDGGDNNQAFFSEERGRTRLNYVISQEAIKEFQVNTQNYSPEFGRAAGGVVNAVTKSGTNEIHGSAFYYLRDASMNARNPLDFISVLRPDNTLTLQAVKADDRRQQFGGTLGGPIVKDKAFWFFNYDQQKRNFPLNAQPSSPTFFNDCTQVAPLPTGACANAVNFILPQTGLYPRRGDQWIFFPKFDWQISGSQQFSASYNYLKWNSLNGIQTQPVVNTAQSNNGPDKVRADILNLRLVSTLTPQMLNEFRFQYGKDFEFEPANEPNSVGLNIGSTRQGNSSTGFNMGIAEFLPRTKFPDERKYQWVDNVTISKGVHTLKFGGDLVYSSDDIDNLRFGAGYYNYGFGSNRQGIQNFALDLATPGARNYSNYTQAFGPSALKFHTWDINMYVQDDWKAKPNLTVNMGLRYELIKMPEPVLINQKVPETAELHEDGNNFGPRIGIAWDLFNNRKNVLRAGYGIYYGRIINSAIYNALTVTGAPGSVFNLRFSNTQGPVYPNKFASIPTGATIPTPDIFIFNS